MATFEKLSTGKVLFTDDDGKIFGLDQSSYIIPLASDPNKIIISTTPIPNESDKGIRINVDSVTLPINSGRGDLVGQLSLDYFNSTVSGGTSDVNVVSPDPLPIEVKTMGEVVSDVNPFPTDGDRIYTKDINEASSDAGGFSLGVLSYFNNLETVSVNSSADAVKSIKVSLNSTQYTSAIGFGCDDPTKEFGQSITVHLLGSADEVRKTIQSPSGNPRSRVVSFTPDALNGFILEFNTTTEVALSNITIRKEVLSASRIQGVDPNGNLRTVNTNILGNLLVSLDEQKDAFGRLKTAEPFTIFDNSLTNPEADVLFWSTLLNGTASGVYERLTSSYNLAVATLGDYIVRQTKSRFKYQPAKSHEWFMTGVLSTQAGIKKRIGLVDYDNVGLATITQQPQNGVFFENNGGVLTWNIVNNGVITESVTQAGWNIDIADGTGRSGFVFNTDSTNIFTCQLEWLGVGVVLVGFAIGAGSVIYVHAFQHASVDGFTEVYMRTANLPVSYSMESFGGAGTMKQICSSVISGGGFNPQGVTNAVQNSADVSVSNGVEEILVGIRLKEDSFEFSINPTFISILSLNNGNSLWCLCINPTYNGTITWADHPNSEIQVAENNGVGGENIISDKGIIVGAGSFSNNADNLNEEIKTALRIGKTLAGVRDEIWLTVTALGNETYRGTINFRQFI